MSTKWQVGCYLCIPGQTGVVGMVVSPGEAVFVCGNEVVPDVIPEDAMAFLGFLSLRARMVFDAVRAVIS